MTRPVNTSCWLGDALGRLLELQLAQLAANTKKSQDTLSSLRTTSCIGVSCLVTG